MGSFSKSRNPVLNSELFKTSAATDVTGPVMSIAGTVNKTMMLFLISLFTAMFAWKNAAVGNTMQGLFPVLLIGGLIVALITKPSNAKITAPIYAALEGFLLGIISFYFEGLYGGIVLQAVLLTFGVMLAVLVLYKMRILQATKGFVKFLTVSILGILGYYVLVLLFGIFAGKDLSVFGLGFWGVVIQFVIVGVAALSFVLDFKVVEDGVANNAPKDYEWYAAFGIMVTLIWLYIEMLRLLAILSRD